MENKYVMALMWTQLVGKPAGLRNASRALRKRVQHWLTLGKGAGAGHRPTKPPANPQTKCRAKFHYEPVHMAVRFPHLMMKALLAPTMGRRKGPGDFPSSSRNDIPKSRYQCTHHITAPWSQALISVETFGGSPGNE